VLLAKMAATLHVLSGQRFVLGVSTSWHAEEYAALGVPFAERGQRLDDAIGACRALWSASPASFTSPTISFDDVYCEPRCNFDQFVAGFLIDLWRPGAATRVSLARRPKPRVQTQRPP
jgi:alkanesulfonate monooxygenase SsuD/methylene tetrahydromethanopterin reductase-like flavin-dependent oxidoreductase (luciferase family)